LKGIRFHWKRARRGVIIHVDSDSCSDFEACGTVKF
jgi:hypothetical protein